LAVGRDCTSLWDGLRSRHPSTFFWYVSVQGQFEIPVGEFGATIGEGNELFRIERSKRKKAVSFVYFEVFLLIE
jgi:hypothetical protein